MIFIQLIILVNLVNNQCLELYKAILIAEQTLSRFSADFFCTTLNQFFFHCAKISHVRIYINVCTPNFFSIYLTIVLLCGGKSHKIFIFHGIFYVMLCTMYFCCLPLLDLLCFTWWSDARCFWFWFFFFFFFFHAPCLQETKDT